MFDVLYVLSSSLRLSRNEVPLVAAYSGDQFPDILGHDSFSDVFFEWTSIVGVEVDEGDVDAALVVDVVSILV